MRFSVMWCDPIRLTNTKQSLPIVSPRSLKTTPSLHVWSALSKCKSERWRHFVSPRNLTLRNLTLSADHIWEYDGYAGYDACVDVLHKSKDAAEMAKQLRSTLASRSNWITQEFAFWATAPPQKSAVERPLYELRTYHLRPGMLLEWEANW